MSCLYGTHDCRICDRAMSDLSDTQKDEDTAPQYGDGHGLGYDAGAQLRCFAPLFPRETHSPSASTTPTVRERFGNLEPVQIPTVVTSSTGGKKGKKDARLSEIDPWALEQLAKVAGHGSDKYGERLNYRRGYDWSLAYDALQRHAMKAWQGEDLDPDSGLPHFAHVAWHALALLSFFHHQIGTDDRELTE